MSKNIGDYLKDIGGAIEEFERTEPDRILGDKEEASQTKVVLDELRKWRDTINKARELGDIDWENPTKEAVAAGVAVGHDIINRLRSLPFLKENKAYQNCLSAVEEAWKGMGAVADALFTAKDFFSVLLAAEANPAAACQVRVSL